MKYIPNIITASRIALSAVLLFTEPFSAIFFVVYLLCGLSDVLDGFLARRLNAQSKLGAVLDSVSDIVFFGVALFLLLPVYATFIPLIAAVAGLRVVNIIISAVKYKKPRFLHTYGNKAAGAAVFLLPIVTILTDTAAAVTVSCIIAAAASAEETLIFILSDNPDTDIRFIGDVKMGKKKREHVVFDRTRDKKTDLPFAKINKETPKKRVNKSSESGDKRD